MTTIPPHPSVTAALVRFRDDHLPVHLQEHTAPFKALAERLAATITGQELPLALLALWEAKNLVVYAVAAEREPQSVHHVLGNVSPPCPGTPGQPCTGNHAPGTGDAL